MCRAVNKGSRGQPAYNRQANHAKKGTAMHMFRNDYSEGAAPQILEALTRTNDEQCVGYTCLLYTSQTDQSRYGHVQTDSCRRF